MRYIDIFLKCVAGTLGVIVGVNLGLKVVFEKETINDEEETQDA